MKEAMLVGWLGMIPAKRLHVRPVGVFPVTPGLQMWTILTTPGADDIARRVKEL